MKHRIVLSVCAAFLTTLSVSANSHPVEFPKGAEFPPATNCGVAVGPNVFAIFYLSDNGTKMESVRFRLEPFTILWYKHSDKDAVGLIAEHCRETARAAGLSNGHWGTILEATEDAKRYFK